MGDEIASVTSATSATETKSLLEFNNDLANRSFSKLSEDLANFLKRAEGCDVKIEIGKEDKVKDFYAHSHILRARSTYFDKALSKKQEETDDDTNTNTVTYLYTALFKTFTAGTESNISIFKEENISPDIFKIILDYIYSGVAKVEEIDKSLYLDLFEACDVLGIHGSSEYLQSYVLENCDEWIRKNLLVIERFSASHVSFGEIRSYCLDQLCQNPEIVFNDTIDLKTLRKGVLTALLSRDDLIADEIVLWDFIIKWGISQDPNFRGDEPTKWTKEDFNKLKTIMGELISLIRFKWINKGDFFQKVRPYKQLFDEQTYESAIELYFLGNKENPVPEVTPQPVSPPETLPDAPPLLIETKARDKNSNLIINENKDYQSLMSSWIDKKSFKKDYQPHKFKLLYRGSTEGFSSAIFHANCDSVPSTLVLAKIKGTGELIGGYNPQRWKIPGQKPTSTYPIYSKKAFIFKIDKDNVEKSILSRVKNHHNALYYDRSSGPNFNDLVIYDQNRPIDQDKNFYENSLNLEGTLLEDYEVYRVLIQH